MFVHKDQLTAFAADSSRAYRSRMEAHLFAAFPRRSARMGTARLRLFVDEQMARARSHGVSREYPMCQYLRVAMVLGPDFDVSTRTAWARELLDNPALGPETGIHVLHRQVFPTPNQVIPPEEAH